MLRSIRLMIIRAWPEAFFFNEDYVHTVREKSDCGARLACSSAPVFEASVAAAQPPPRAFTIAGGDSIPRTGLRSAEGAAPVKPNGQEPPRKGTGSGSA